MTDLSPETQAVMFAFTRGNRVLMGDPVYRSVAAEGLLAAADQVDARAADDPTSEWGTGWRDGVRNAGRFLRSLAAELEGRQ